MEGGYVGHMKKIFPLMTLLLVLSVHADEKELPVLQADNTKAIEASMGKEATVEGKIHAAFWVRDSVLMLTFREEREGFIAVSFKKHREELDAAFGGDITKALRGKTVRIRGKVEEYKYRPQIVIRNPDQIETLMQ